MGKSWEFEQGNASPGKQLLFEQIADSDQAIIDTINMKDDSITTLTNSYTSGNIDINSANIQSATISVTNNIVVIAFSFTVSDTAGNLSYLALKRGSDIIYTIPLISGGLAYYKGSFTDITPSDASYTYYIYGESSYAYAVASARRLAAVCWKV